MHDVYDKKLKTSLRYDLRGKQMEFYRIYYEE